MVTSLEFERMLSASGPSGHLMRPSDGQEPKRIAWLQCVGSRDINHCDNGYCSSVCCMYANKQAVIAKEHSAERSGCSHLLHGHAHFGKDFDKYNLRAEDDHGVRFVRSRIHSVDFRRRTSACASLRHRGRRAGRRDLRPGRALGRPDGDPQETVALAERLGVELNATVSRRTARSSPVQTSRDGIYVCGAFQEPKDIPHSVMEASAAAAWPATAWPGPRLVPDPDQGAAAGARFLRQPPRIGVFVCNCGINIGGVADVPAVREYARTLPHVVHVEDNLFTCSQDTQVQIKEVIKEKQINRVVVASCSPRTHEPLFQETIREAGLNKYLFEMANIRDQNTWVHMNNPAKATEKAKDLVRMAVAKAAYIEPLHQ